MPISVPQVPFRSPGEEDAVWVDVYNRLYRKRLLFLGQEVDSETLDVQSTAASQRISGRTS